jgi:hypothetical protein
MFDEDWVPPIKEEKSVPKKEEIKAIDMEKVHPVNDLQPELNTMKNDEVELGKVVYQQ